MAAYEAARASALVQQGSTAEIAAIEATVRPEHTRFLAELGQTQSVIVGRMSSSRQRRGDYAGAERDRHEDVDHLRRVQPMHPEQQQFWSSLSTSLFLQAALELQLARPADALVSMRESMDWNRRQQEKEPDNARLRSLADARALILGAALLETGAAAEARPWLQRARIHWAAEAARDGSARNVRTAALAELRLARAAGDGAAVRAASGRLQALSAAAPADVDHALAAAEAAFGLRDKPAGCTALGRAAEQRPLPPQALAWRVELGC